MRSRFDDPAWRTRPLRTSLRVAGSLIRRRVPSLRETWVSQDGGRSEVLADLGTAMGLRLYRYGWSEPALELVAHRLQPGDLFIDGGANIGLFSLVAAARVGPTGAVHAFEPAPGTAARLERNLARNRMDWIHVHRQALADVPGTLELTTFEGDASGLSSFAPADDRGAKRVSVDVVRLDDVFPAEVRSRIALIKLDLEGAEHRALRGAAALLREHRPDLLLELEPDHLARQGSSAEELVTELRALGYRIFEIGARFDGSTRAMTPSLIPLESLEVARENPNVFASCRP